MRQKNNQMFLVIILILMNAIIGFAQNPADKPIKQKKEPNANKVFERWLDEDVSLIITRDERDAFFKLK